MIAPVSQLLAEVAKVKRPALPKPAMRLSEKPPSRVEKPKKKASTAAERASAIKKQLTRQKAAKTRETKARAAQKAGLEKSKAVRLARRAAAMAIIGAEKAVEKPKGLRDIPAQIAHCMMAVHVKGKKSKQAAWKICRWAMTKNGYLDGPYRANTKMPKAVKQTAKGTRRSFQHGMEKGPLNGGLPGNGVAKFKKFVSMFRALEPQILPKTG